MIQGCRADLRRGGPATSLKVSASPPYSETHRVSRGLATLDSFQPYSTSHATVILVLLAITALPVVLARRWRGTGRDRTLDRAIAVACLFIWATVKVFRMLPTRYDPSKAIPLQVCDWVGFIAPLAIWTG